jgi:hypothetical protein
VREDDDEGESDKPPAEAPPAAPRPTSPSPTTRAPCPDAWRDIIDGLTISNQPIAAVLFAARRGASGDQACSTGGPMRTVRGPPLAARSTPAW